jgi:hypothetical protein
MLAKKLPETNEERLNVLRAILEQEEINEESDKVLSIVEFQELRLFTNSFEATESIFIQTITDRDKAKILYNDLFKNAQLYISHFIQVLFLTLIRNEIKAENLALYGFQDNIAVLPDLSTEEAVLQWGENLMRGETERTYRGGIPLYNPAIAKVKVHYELFKECIYSLVIYEKNLLRMQNTIDEKSNKADELILDIWAKVEELCSKYPPDVQASKHKAYKIQFIYRKGDQLNVFDI